MSKKYFTLIIVYLIYMSCNNNSGIKKKIFIKSVKFNHGMRIDWYVEPKFNRLTPDYLQINTNENIPFFKSFFLSDFRISNDSIYISLCGGTFELDKSKIIGFNVVIDSTGGNWNSSVSRFDRLKGKGVDMEKPHYVDSYCNQGLCDQK